VLISFILLVFLLVYPLFFFFKQKTAYVIGLGIPAEPLFRSVFRLLRLKRFSTFSVKVLNLFSRSRRKTNKRKSKHSAMLRNKEKIGRASCRERVRIYMITVIV